MDEADPNTAEDSADTTSCTVPTSSEEHLTRENSYEAQNEPKNTPQSLIALPPIQHDINIINKIVSTGSMDFISEFNVQSGSDLLFFFESMEQIVISPEMFFHFQFLNLSNLKDLKTVECKSKSLQELQHFTLSDNENLKKVILQDNVASNIMNQDRPPHVAYIFVSEEFQNRQQQEAEQDSRLLAYISCHEPVLENPPSFILTRLQSLEEIQIGVGCGLNFDAFTLSGESSSLLSFRTPKSQNIINWKGKTSRCKLVSVSHFPSTERYDRRVTAN